MLLNLHLQLSLNEYIKFWGHTMGRRFVDYKHSTHWQSLEPMPSAKLLALRRRMHLLKTYTLRAINFVCACVYVYVCVCRKYMKIRQSRLQYAQSIGEQRTNERWVGSSDALKCLIEIAIVCECNFCILFIFVLSIQWITGKFTRHITFN